MTPGIDPESETQNENQMSESYNKTTETESERSINIDRFRKNFGPGFTLNENKMFCKVCMKAGKKNSMTIGCTTFKTGKCM